MSPADEDHLPDRARLIALGMEVHDLFIKMPTPVVVDRKKIPGGNRAYVPTVFALAMHTLHSGRAALELQQDGRYLVAMPLVRLSFETAINVQWLVHSQRGLWGFLNEGIRQRRNLLRTMTRSPHQLFSEGATNLLATQDGHPPSFTDAAARHFQQMCEAIEGGHDAYVLYRLLSESSHPGPSLVDEYVAEDLSSEAGVRLTRLPNDRTGGNDKHWTWTTATSMMWAGRALDHLQQAHVHRSRLRQIARELGVTETLSLTPRAQREYAQREQEERRARWKGPKSRRLRSQVLPDDDPAVTETTPRSQE